MTDPTLIRSRAQRIPPLPGVALKVLRLLDNPETDIAEIVETIRLDAALTLRVLKICNSPYYGLSREIRSLQEAVVLLGVDALANMVLTSGLSSILSGTCRGYRLEDGALWAHSVCCAIVAELAAEKVDPKLKGQAFTGGLLHDVGKIVLSEYVDEDLEQISNAVAQEAQLFHVAEHDVIGMSHTEAGAIVADCWDLPEALKFAILYHHDPLQAPDHRTLVALIHLSDAICASMGFGLGVDGLAMELSHEALENCGLTPNDILAISAGFLDRFERAKCLIES